MPNHADHALHDILTDFLRPYIPNPVQLHRACSRLRKGIKAAMRESVRELPGRAQAGAVDSAVMAVLPKLREHLKL